MESKLLQLRGGTWACSILGEQAVLLEPKLKEVPLTLIHEAAMVLERAEIQGVVDVIPAYQNIALVYNRILDDLDEETDRIEEQTSGESGLSSFQNTHKVPVCYEMGLDWQEVTLNAGLQKEEIISIHLQAEYTVAMMGFTPGFLYLTGLNESIFCPRKENPRTRVPAGSVGIGGTQAGIYSLESPGGWQIIGQTPLSFFDASQEPPSIINPGDKVLFFRISEQDFEKVKEVRV